MFKAIIYTLVSIVVVHSLLKYVIVPGLYNLLKWEYLRRQRNESVNLKRGISDQYRSALAIRMAASQYRSPIAEFANNRFLVSELVSLLRKPDPDYILFMRTHFQLHSESDLDSEVFSVELNKWFRGPCVPERTTMENCDRRVSIASTRLSDGRRMLFITGRSPNSCYSATLPVENVLESLDRIEWKRMPDMPTDRGWGPSLVVVGDYLYAIKGTKNDRWCDVFSIRRNRWLSWIELPAAPPVRNFHISSAVSVGGKLWVYGRIDAIGGVDFFAVYDPLLNSWVAKSDFFWTQFPCVLSVDDRHVCVFGGPYAETIEKYTGNLFQVVDESGHVETKGELNFPTRSASAAVAIGHKVYVLGNFDRFYRDPSYHNFEKIIDFDTMEITDAPPHTFDIVKHVNWNMFVAVGF